MSLRVLPVLSPVTALLLLLAGTAGAQQPGRPYVGPLLRRLLAPETRRTAAPAGRFDMLPVDAPLPMQRQLAVDRDRGGRPQVGVFVELADAGALAALRAHGAQVGTVVRRADGRLLATARVPLDAADSVTRLPGLVAVYAAARVKVSNDSGVHAIKADQVRQRSGSTWAGSAGQGVIVGVYDTGLDFTHGDFLDGNGNTRVLAAWDQTGTGSPPGMGFNYGNYCTQAMIQSTIAGTGGGCSLVDSHGHGTHVTGTAAGNGASAGTGTPFQYAGVAPAADIVSVKGGNGSFDFDHIIDGIAFVDSLAARLHKPAAVNLSLGGGGGAHDGSSLPEQMIDALARAGFAVVVAAGNEGSNGSSLTGGAQFLFHAAAPVVAGAQQSVSLRIPTYTPYPGACQNAELIDIWYGGADAIDLSVMRPNGTLVTAATGHSISDDASSGFVEIDNASSGPDPENRDNEALIRISDCGTSDSSPASGIWRIQVTGRSVASGKPFHVWLVGGDLGGNQGEGVTGFDNRYIVGVPGTARSVITVGAFTTRQSWISTDNASHYYTDRTALGDLANFSSGGPSRDERQKPEIAAPGAAVVSALSKNARPASQLMVAVDGKHWALEGTSMATPHVTGAVALMFQARPDLTSSQLKALFAASAAHDAFTSKTYGVGSPSDWWGAGKLDVRAALAALNLDPGLVASVALSVHADTLVRNATDRLTATVYNALGTRLDSAVTWSSSNTAVVSVDATGLIHAVATGQAWVIAAVGTHRDSASIVVVTPSTLAINGHSIVTPQPAGAGASSKRGTLLPLLALDLVAHGYEGVRVSALAFDVKGRDPGARLVLIRDVDRSGTIGSSDTQLATAPAALLDPAQAVRITFVLDSLVVPANDSTSLIAALEMSGQAENATTFSATVVRQATHTLGVRSQAVDQLEGGTPATLAGGVVTTVLQAGERFALSENPVRHGHVIFNFSERPTVAAIYSLSGRRVADLTKQITSDGRLDWQLRNDDGRAVANGIYLLVFDVGGEVVRQKLFIARPQE